MLGARQELAQKLGDALNGFKVIPGPRGVDDIQEPAVLMVRDSIEPAPNTLGNFKETYVLWVISPTKIQPKAEDDLDDNTDMVIAALDDIPWLTWSRADRAKFGEQAPAYKITTTVYSNKEQS